MNTLKLKKLSQCCKYSIKAYRSHDKLIYIDGLNNVKNKHDAQAIVLKENSKLYIAFRGSSTVNDFKDVFTIIPHKMKEGSIHRGFYHQYLSLKPELDDYIQDPSIDEVYYIGHSMGGSVALIAAVLNAETNKNKDIYCYTYGAPVTGTKCFLDYAGNLLTDFVSVEIDKDLIPKIPLNPLFSRMTNTLEISNINDMHILDIMGNHSCYQYYLGLRKMIKESFDSNLTGI